MDFLSLELTLAWQQSIGPRSLWAHRAGIAHVLHGLIVVVDFECALHENLIE